MTRNRKLDIAPRGEREIVMHRSFDAPPELVWEAYTRPELLQRWMLGPPGWSLEILEMDLRPGGRFRWVWRQEDGRAMAVSGTYREIEAPRLISHTELFDEDWTGGETLETMTLEAKDGGTLMTTTWLYTSAEAREAALRSGMEIGMEAGFERLEVLLAEMPAA